MPAANHITQLRQGQQPPAGPPVGRYRNGEGYTRLRWQTGPRRYVEAYEHRHVAKPGPGQLVHHRGGRSDNAPAKLVNVTPSQHQHVERAKRANSDAKLASYLLARRGERPARR